MRPIYSGKQESPVMDAGVELDNGKVEMKKETVEIICRALLAIVAALRKEYGLPEYHNVTISLNDNIAGMSNGDILPQ